MKKSRFTDEQIIGALQQLDSGVPAKDVARDIGVNAQTLCKRSGNGVLDNPIEVRPPRIICEALLPQPRRQSRDVAGGVILNALQDIHQIGVRIDLLQPAGCQQALEDPNVLGPDFGPTKHPVFPVMRSCA